MTSYEPPKSRVHRGFFYLDDETVINSLSAIESGKIDEVVAKVASAREGGLGGALGIQGAKFEGGKKATSALEEEMVRTRTRFSVFELWHQTLKSADAMGRFEGWGEDALEGVLPGDTVEFRCLLEVAPIQILFRLYLWFADKAKSSGHIFSQTKDALKETKEAERNIKIMMGEPDEDSEEVIVLATPIGEGGPAVAMPLKRKWLIGMLGQLGGEYTVIGQVDRLVPAGDEIAALRLTQDVPPTPLELKALKEATANFAGEASASMGIEIDEHAASIPGPALWLEPIAVFR